LVGLTEKNLVSNLVDLLVEKKVEWMDLLKEKKMDEQMAV
jgi:hypothetical protein